MRFSKLDLCTPFGYAEDVLQARRIEPHAASPFSSRKLISINFEGRQLPAREGEPLAVALLAAGINIFSRSPKYHRPRGPFCLLGQCSSCLMRVDGEPNVRSCRTPCREGLRAERQGGWPSAQFDFWRALDWAFSERLDHHSWLAAPAALNRLAARFVRKFTGFGELPATDRLQPFSYSEKKIDALVIGGGPAGLETALTLAEGGIRTVLLEATEQLGGRLLDEPSGLATLGQLKERLNGCPSLEVHLATPAVAVYPEDFLVVGAGPSCTLYLRPRKIIVCTGDYQQVPLLENNDLPGVFSLRALSRMVFLYGLVPPEPIVLCGVGADISRLAIELSRIGVKLAALVAPDGGGENSESLLQAGVSQIKDRQPVGLRGTFRLEAIELAPISGGPADRQLECQSCALQYPAAPAYELAHHAGCRVTFHSENGFAVAVDEEGRTSHESVFAAGHCTGRGDIAWALQRGKAAARACTLSLSGNSDQRK